MNRLEGKVALISGGARGQGASHGRYLAREGARVVLGDILDTEGEQVACEIGANARYVHLDVTKRDDWDAAVATATEAFGGVDILVNNAGIAEGFPFEDYPESNFRRVIEINLFGQFHGLQAVIPAMRERGGGSVINISSIAGQKAYPALSAYVTSKFGVRGLTKAAAVDLGGYQIRVNSIHPGGIDTPMTVGVDRQPFIDGTPLHRFGEVDDISNLVVFLASDESRNCTGAEFVSDGGEMSGTATPIGGLQNQ